MACDGKSVGKFPELPGVDHSAIRRPNHPGLDPVNSHNFSVENPGIPVVGADEQPVAGSDLQLSGPRDGKGTASERQPPFAGRSLDKDDPVCDSQDLGEFSGMEPMRRPVERGDHSDLVIPGISDLGQGPLQGLVRNDAFSGAEDAPGFELGPQFRG